MVADWVCWDGSLCSFLFFCIDDWNILEQSAGQPVLAAASDLVVPPLCAPGSLGEMLRKMEYSIPNSDHGLFNTISIVFPIRMARD